MPIHDWTRVHAGTFHSFHQAWLTHLMDTLNAGLLPPDFYALSEQIATRMQSDVLTLQRSLFAKPDSSPGVAVAEAPPRAKLRLRPDPKRRPKTARKKPSTLVVRHATDHRIVALIEVVSPANKDRRDHVRDLANKVVQCIESEIHVLLIDLLPTGRHDPHGIHGEVWSHYDTEPYSIPSDGPLTLAAYIGRPGDPEAFVEPVAFGQLLPEMPLFLNEERYVNVPLEVSYARAWGAIPAFIREELATKTPVSSNGASDHDRS